MTRDEAIKKLADADGPHGYLYRRGDWARTLVLSLEILGVLKLDDEKEKNNDRIQG